MQHDPIPGRVDLQHVILPTDLIHAEFGPTLRQGGRQRDSISTRPEAEEAIQHYLGHEHALVEFAIDPQTSCDSPTL